MKLLKKFVLFIAFVSILLIPGGNVFADSKEFNFNTGCSETTDGSYTAILDIDSPKDVFVKLGAKGQKLQVSINQVNESLEGSCRRIATTEINGTSWTKVGALLPGDGRVVLEVISPALANVPDATRPGVLILDQANPICIPAKQCDLSINGVPAFVRPPSTLQDKASLFVSTPRDPANDAVERVDYYVAGRIAYSRPSLEPFDMRYASYSDQDLLRVARYKSGQEIVYPSTVPAGFSDTFGNFVFRTFRLDSKLAAISFWIILILIVLSVLYGLLRLFVAHYRRLINHNLVGASSFWDKLGAKVESFLEKIDNGLERTLFKQKLLVKFIVIFWIIPVFLFGTYYLTTHSVATVIYVNGHSMDSTFTDGKPMLVNRLPQTFARFNNSQLKLKRGDVVVLDAIYGLVSKETMAENEHIIVKRVAGLPGERVTVQNGVIKVYNKENPKGVEFDKGSAWDKTMHKETTTNGIDITLAADEIFIAGDNRPGSVDSRFNGPVKVDQVIGKVIKHWK